MNKLSGIFTALLTPFHPDGSVNVKELKRLVKLDLDLGAQGFYVCGTTAEAFFMTEEERRTVMETVRSAAPDVPLIAQIGSLDFRQAQSLAGYAGLLGYDAISSVAPFYYKYTFAEISEYYRRLADAAGLRMLVYYFPASSGVTLSAEALTGLISDGGFAGMKFTCGDLFLMETCKRALGDKTVLNGFDEIFLSGLCAGADGGVGSTYNFMADKFVAIRSLFLEGRIAEAKRIQSEVNRIVSVLLKVGVMQGEKEILNQMGLDMGFCRPPFSELDPEAKRLIKEQIVDKL